MNNKTYTVNIFGLTWGSTNVTTYGKIEITGATDYWTFARMVDSKVKELGIEHSGGNLSWQAYDEKGEYWNHGDVR